MYELETVSIIIPAWNESLVLPSTLNSLRKILYDLNKVEIIIIAGGIDNTLSIANELNSTSFERTNIIEQRPGMGKSQAIIEGLKVAKNDVIVLLDADCTVDKNWLSELVKSLNNGFDAVSGNCYPTKKHYTAVEAYKRTGYNHAIKYKVATLNGMASIAFKKSILIKFGIEYFFDKDLIANDDIFFLLKLNENGYNVGIVENAVIYSHYPVTFTDFIKEDLRWRQAWFQLSQKNVIDLKNAFFHSMIISVLPLASIISIILYFIQKNLIYASLMFFCIALLCVFSVKVFKIVKPLIDEDSRYLFTILGITLLHLIDHTLIVYTVVINAFTKDKKVDLHFKGARRVN
jgi:cellulose synthase/poly-beta-1,6-N-acetylglucosamine synthase-like glycosyltransferase